MGGRGRDAGERAGMRAVARRRRWRRAGGRGLRQRVVAQSGERLVRRLAWRGDAGGRSPTNGGEPHAGQPAVRIYVSRGGGREP